MSAAAGGDGAADNILAVVAAAEPRLRPSERKVAAVVAADPRRILAATIAEAARLAGVSQPTVIRFANAVGCAGYQDFRLRLARSLAFGTPATHSAVRPSDGPDELVGKVFDHAITSLDWARGRLDRAALARAVDLLAAARAIEFFGLGASAIVARDAQQKFPLFGVPCGAEADPHQQLMVAAMMRPGDVAVAISHTGATRAVIAAAEAARAAGAAVIGLVGRPSPLADACDVAIVVETLDNTDLYTPTTSRLAALVVVDVLSTGVALRRDPGHLDRVAAMKRRLAAARSAGRD